MSQPQLTKFFANTKKRDTRASAKAKQLLETETVKKNIAPPDKIVIKEILKEKIVSEVVESSKSKVKSRKVVKDSEANVVNVDVSDGKVSKKEDLCPSPTKRTRRSSRSQSDAGGVKEDLAKKIVSPKKRNTTRAQLAELNDNINTSCPVSPSKKAKDSSNNSVAEAIESAKQLKGKLTPHEVKAQLKQLKGRNKLAVLQKQLKTIEEQAKTVEQLKEEAKAKEKAAEAEAKAAEEKAEKAARLATPAYQRFHNLACKDDGTLPLPYTYKFLLEKVFRTIEDITRMLHNRKEIITIEKLKNAVQRAIRKDFHVDYLKQIKSVFPAAYKYVWRRILGRYGKALQDYEMHIQVNLDYKLDTLGMMNADTKDEESVKGDKVEGFAITERANIFRNLLLGLVKQHHKEFCNSIGIEVEDDNIKRFHKDFDVDSCPPVPCSEFPEKPHVEKVATAAEILDKARDLFEVNPKVCAVLEQVADKTAKEKEEIKEKVEVKVVEPVVPKALSSVPMSLLEKIRAKEREKKAKEMYQSKDEEVKMRRLKRLPEIARIVKGVFVSEQRNALKKAVVLQKVYQSYPGFTEKEVLALDLDKLAEVSSEWMTVVTIQKEGWIKLNKDLDVNVVVKKLEGLGQTK